MGYKTKTVQLRSFSPVFVFVDCEIKGFFKCSALVGHVRYSVCLVIVKLKICKHCTSGMPGVGFMVWVVGLGTSGPEFKSHSAAELLPGGVDSACHLSEVGKVSASHLVLEW